MQDVVQFMDANRQETSQTVMGFLALFQASLAIMVRISQFYASVSTIIFFVGVLSINYGWGFQLNWIIDTFQLSTDDGDLGSTDASEMNLLQLLKVPVRVLSRPLATPLLAL